MLCRQKVAFWMVAISCPENRGAAVLLHLLTEWQATSSATMPTRLPIRNGQKEICLALWYYSISSLAAGPGGSGPSFGANDVGAEPSAISAGAQWQAMTSWRRRKCCGRAQQLPGRGSNPRKKTAQPDISFHSSRRSLTATPAAPRPARLCRTLLHETCAQSTACQFLAQCFCRVPPAALAVGWSMSPDTLPSLQPLWLGHRQCQ